MVGRTVLFLAFLVASRVHADTVSRATVLLHRATSRTAVKLGKGGSQVVPIPIIPKLGEKLARLNRLTERKPNTEGEVFILQYHGVVPSEKRYDRSEANFWRDLERVYKLGMRPVTLSEYVENRMNIQPGATPVVITFDDAKASQFQILKDGSIDPHCAIGVWKRFWELHPDFPIKGMFYVTVNMMWGQPKLVDQKLKMLKDWGSEIGDHTMTHPPLSKLGEDAAIREIGGPAAYLAKKGITDHIHFCIPYGLMPRDKKLVEQVNFRGHIYKFESNTLCGANPAPSPSSKKFKPYRIPRILCNNEVDGINTWLALAEKGKLNLYVQP